uniref:Uncharacterized protein n=1 Tax=Ixodes ricinus TaxID=34613 RepID=A0A6B0UDE0_IXORI
MVTQPTSSLGLCWSATASSICFESCLYINVGIQPVDTQISFNLVKSLCPSSQFSEPWLSEPIGKRHQFATLSTKFNTHFKFVSLNSIVVKLLCPG